MDIDAGPTLNEILTALNEPGQVITQPSQIQQPLFKITVIQDGIETEIMLGQQESASNVEYEKEQFRNRAESLPINGQEHILDLLTVPIAEKYSKTITKGKAGIVIDNDGRIKLITAQHVLNPYYVLNDANRETLIGIRGGGVFVITNKEDSIRQIENFNPEYKKSSDRAFIEVDLEVALKQEDYEKLLQLIEQGTVIPTNFDRNGHRFDNSKRVFLPIAGVNTGPVEIKPSSKDTDWFIIFPKIEGFPICSGMSGTPLIDEEGYLVGYLSFVEDPVLGRVYGGEGNYSICGSGSSGAVVLKKP